MNKSKDLLAIVLPHHHRDPTIEEQKQIITVHYINRENRREIRLHKSANRIVLFEILRFQKKIKYLFDFQFVWLPISSDETEKSVEEQKRIIQFISRYINRENIERERERW